MNYQEKQLERKKIKGFFLNNYPEGTLKLSIGESLEHFLVKCQVAYYLKLNSYEIWSEPTLKGLKKRPDLLCLHKSGNIAYIVEIVKSESESSLIKKSKVYPLPIIVVNTKNFKFEEFKL